MGIFDSLKINAAGTRAYRTHVTAGQLKQNGKYEEAQQKLEEAYVYYEEAYRMGYRKANVMISFAILLMQRGDFERARELMLDASKDKTLSQEDRFSLRINFSICQWKQGKLDKAIESVRMAAQTKMNGMVYATLGMLLVEQAKETGAFEEALAFNQEALEYDDEDAATLDNMGQLYLLMSEDARRKGEAQQAAEYRKLAIEYLRKAYERKPSQVTTVYYLAKLDHEDGDDRRAREMIDACMKLPCTAICAISKEEIEALSREIGK